MKTFGSLKLSFTTIRSWTFSLVAVLLLAGSLASHAQSGAGFALDFDGVNDAVNNGAGKFPTTFNSFTMELWVKPTKGRTNTVESNAGFDGITNHSYAIFPELGSTPYGGLNHAGAGISIGTNGVSVVEHSAAYMPTVLVYNTLITNWTHIAVVYSNRQPSLYINGVFIKTGLTGGLSFVHPSASLNDSAYNYGPFKGQIDEVRIWNSARSAAQIATNWNSALLGLDSGLLAYYKLNTGSGTVAFDSSGTADSTLLNGVAWVASTAPVGTLLPLASPTTSITNSSATLNGFVNPDSHATTAWFEWGTTPAYGNTTSAQSLGSGVKAVSVSATLSNLQGLTTYYWRVVSSNTLVATSGGNSFTTLPTLPVPTTTAASGITVSNAVLNGSVIVNTLALQTWFEWGTTTNYGFTTPLQALGSGTNAVPVSQVISNLAFGSVYHYRVAVSNSDTVLHGNDQSFTTLSGIAAVTTTAASSIAAHAAVLNGSVIPNGLVAETWFEWGKTVSYGFKTSLQSIGNGTTAIPVSQAISNLLTGGSYHYRAVASNILGVVQGSDQLFTSSPSAPTVTTMPATAIAPNNATLNGSFSANGLDLTTWFQWGNSTNFGFTTVRQTNSVRGLYFDGTTGYVSTGAGRFSDVTDNFTMEFWAFPTASRAVTAETNAAISGTGGQRYAIFPELEPSGVNRGAGVSVGTNGVSVFEHASALLTSTLVYNGVLSGWTHVAVVYTNRQPLLYLNGVLVRTGVSNASVSVHPSANFGESGTSYGPYQGGLDDVRIWNTPLSGTTLQGWMNQTVITNHPFYSNLIGNWIFDEDTGITTHDYSPRAGNGTLVNGVNWPSSLTNVSAFLSQLTAGATYYYRIVGSNSFGTFNGATLSFTTMLEPTVITDNPTSVNRTSATLNGRINPNGSNTAYQFQWGTTTNYGSSSSFVAIGSGTNLVNGSASISNLIVQTVYHFRIVATNSSGISYGLDKTLVTASSFSNVVSGLPALTNVTAAWADYDNDGFLDVLLVGSSGPALTQLWRNMGNGTFTNVNSGLPAATGGRASWGDYDNDGLLDLALTGIVGGQSSWQIWRNVGDGTFANIASAVDSVDSVAWGDFDNDGRLDILLGGNVQVWRNVGNGVFTNINIYPEFSGQGYCIFGSGSVAWGDYDNDGRLDLLFAGDNDYVGDLITQIWRNVGDGTFTNINAGLTGVIGSVAWGDYDSDGRLDVLVAGNTPSGYVTEIWRNVGSGVFNNVNAALGGARNAVWGDYDNDGLLDILASSPGGSQIWRNVGSGTFNLPFDYFSGLPAASAIALGDYDNDTRLDILVDSQLLHNDTGSATNTPPTAPSALVSSVDGRIVSLSWSPGNDSATPADGLTYNLQVGMSPTSGEIVQPSSAANGKPCLPRMGNVQNGTNAILSKGPGIYYWSVQALDAGFAGSPFSTTNSFTILPLATVTPAENISVTTATLAGTVQAGTTPQQFQFLYGTNGLFNNSTPLQTLAPGELIVRVTAPITGLLPATVYNYKLFVVSYAGSTNSAALTFTSAVANKPTFDSVGATNLSTNSALLTARLQPNNRTTSAAFSYGVNGVYNNFTPIQTFQGFDYVTVTAMLTNLSPGQTYNFHFIASNLVGTVIGTNLAFQTLVPPFTVTSAAVQTNGQFKLQFNGLAGAPYTVLVSTNLSTWDVIGTATQLSPGSFQFVDTGSTNQPRRFYLLRNP